MTDRLKAIGHFIYFSCTQYRNSKVLASYLAMFAFKERKNIVELETFRAVFGRHSNTGTQYKQSKNTL